MRSRLLILVLPALLALSACDQKPVGLPVRETGSWRTLFEFPGSIYAGPLWAFGPGDAYVVMREVGECSLRHYDGANWTSIETPDDFCAVDMWASAPNDIFFAAYDEIVHYDGSTWTSIAIPASGIEGTSSADVYAYDGGVVRHFDGADWTEILAGRYVQAMWAGPGGRALVATDDYYGEPDSLQWWDGNAWTSTETPGRVRALWGSDQDQIFAVGWGASGAAIWEWDGVSWTQVVSTSALPAFLGIDGNGPDDVMAVGGDGIAFRFDGVQWEQIDRATKHAFYGVAAASGGEYFVTASDGSVWNRRPGADWDRTMGYPLASDDGPLLGESRNSMWLGSRTDGLHRLQDGQGREEFPNDSGRVEELVGASPNDVYAAMGFYGVRHFDGTAWTPVLEDARDVVGMWALPGGGVCILDERNGLYTFDGSQWVNIPEDEFEYVSGQLWASSVNDVWIVGYEHVLQWDGSSVKSMLNDRWAMDVWGRSAGDVFVVGNGIQRFHEGVWTRVGPPGRYQRIAGSEGRIVAVGDGAALFDNGYWRTLDPVPYPLDAVVGMDGEIYLLQWHESRRVSILTLP
jgi:hypothetical protein